MNIITHVDFPAYRKPTRRKTLQFQQHVLETLFEAFTRINAAWLHSRKGVPLLYRSGIYYKREFSPEQWLDIPSIIAQGYDDCEGLACWLAAECRVRAPNSVGPHRRPHACVVLKQTKPWLWHAIVEDKDTGERFDPSKRLGM